MSQLLQLLQERGLITVISTVSGDYHYTTTGLMSTISSLLSSKNHRMSTIDISSTLNLDIDDVHSIATRFSPQEVVSHKGDLISAPYWSTICSSISNSLQSEGFLDLYSLSKLYNVTIDVLKTQLSRHNCEPFFHAHFYLLSSWFKSKCDDVILQLTSVETPIILTDLEVVQNLPQDIIDLVVDTIRESLQGEFDKDTFIPTVYTEKSKISKVDQILQDGIYYLNDRDSLSFDFLINQIDGFVLGDYFVTSLFFDTICESILTYKSNDVIDLSVFVQSDLEFLENFAEFICSTFEVRERPMINIGKFLIFSSNLSEFEVLFKNLSFPVLEEFVLSNFQSSPTLTTPKKKKKGGKKNQKETTEVEKPRVDAHKVLDILNEVFVLDFDLTVKHPVVQYFKNFGEEIYSTLITQISTPTRDSFQNQLNIIADQLSFILTEHVTFSSSIKNDLYSKDLHDLNDVVVKHFLKTVGPSLCQLLAILIETHVRFENSHPLPSIKIDEKLNLPQSLKILANSSPQGSYESIDNLIDSLKQSNDVDTVSEQLVIATKTFGVTLPQPDSESITKFKHSKFLELSNFFKTSESAPEMFHLLIELVQLSDMNGFPFVYIPVPPKLILRLASVFESKFKISGLNSICSRVTEFLMSKPKEEVVEKKLMQEISTIFDTSVVIPQ
ncbi:hypothetical protein GEMRC1_006342 [Eukaryota sp. GEM-RC1]